MSRPASALRRHASRSRIAVAYRYPPAGFRSPDRSPYCTDLVADCDQRSTCEPSHLRPATAHAPLRRAALSVSVGTILRHNMLLGRRFDHLTRLASPPLEPAQTRHPVLRFVGLCRLNRADVAKTALVYGSLITGRQPLVTP